MGTEDKRTSFLFVDLASAVFLGAGFAISLDAADLTAAVDTGDGFVRFVLRLLAYLVDSLPADCILTGLIGIAFFMLLRKTRRISVESSNTGDRIWIAVFSALFAFFQVLAYSFNQVTGAKLITGTAVVCIKSLWKMAAYFAMAYALTSILVHGLGTISPGKDPAGDRSGRLRAFMLVWVCYLLLLSAFFPGIISEDGQTQIGQYYGYFRNHIMCQLSPWYGVRDFKVVNSHPFLTTYLFGGFVNLGNRLGGPWIGIFLYSFVQSFAAAAVFVGSVYRFEQFGLKRVFIRSAVAFYILFIPMQFWAITMVKDTLFGILHVLLIMSLIRLVHSSGELIRKRSFFWKLTMIGMAYSVVRSQGLIVMTIVCSSAAFVYRKYWKRIIVMLLVILLFCQVLVNGLLAAALNVAPGGKQETLGVMFQQTARYVAGGYEVTPQEEEAIRRVLDYDHLAENYMPTKQDPVKFTFNPKATKDDMRQYYKAWWHMFLRHPGVYLGATFNTVYGFFLLRRQSEYIYHKINENKVRGKPEIDYDYSGSSVPKAARTLAVQAVELMQRLPVTGLLLSMASFLWLSLLGFFLMRKLGKKYLLSFLPTIVLLAGVVFYPANAWRYFVPVIMPFPILVLTIVWLAQEKNDPAEAAGLN